MNERSKDPPAEGNAAEAGRQHAEADRDEVAQRPEDKAEQQEAAEGERRRAEKGREIREEIRVTAEVMRDMGGSWRRCAARSESTSGDSGPTPAPASEPPPRDRAGGVVHGEGAGGAAVG